MSFTQPERQTIRDTLIERAARDDAIASAVVFGSYARGEEDAWSDIDLGFRVSAGADARDVCERWTAYMKQAFGVCATLDVWSGGALYRVFLLDSTLQIDLSFWPSDRFTIVGPHYRLLFGEADFADPPPPDVDQMLGMGWLYLLHSRSYIARGRGWQAQLMLEELRNRIFALKCHRHGVPYGKGRGIDLLPENETRDVGGCMPASRDRPELCRAFLGLSAHYLREASLCGRQAAQGLAVPVGRMRASVEALAGR